MNRQLKYLIIIISFVFIYWFVQQPIQKIGADSTYAASPQNNEELTQSELSDFLGLWQRMTTGPLKKYAAQQSLKNSETYSRQVVNWLELQNWSAERFFYIEQRLISLVDCINLRNQIDANIALNKQSEHNLSPIIEDLKQKFLVCQRYNSEELKLIEDNLENIKQVMQY